MTDIVKRTTTTLRGPLCWLLALLTGGRAGRILDISVGSTQITVDLNPRGGNEAPSHPGATITTGPA